ncbi:leucine-rich repeat transmembrane protein FLRT1-like [Centruroides vittatus]|uniref:leucine-rich repeat transmembrane protein FLRT1-like n=1 Tax=Centruroides vittatus TaxID=120091 RepID=UPI00351083CA
MHSKYLTWVALLTLCKTIKTRKEGCPPEEEMPRCVCDWPRGIICNGIMSHQELNVIMDALSGYKVSTLRLNRAILMYLPSGMFKEVPIRALDIRKSDVLGTESEDGSVMFEGAEDSLQVIRLFSVKGLNSWRWIVLSTLKNLQFLYILRGELRYVDKDFTTVAPETLTQLRLEFCEIRNLDKHAFSKHIMLKELSLQDNELTEIKRSMLPSPALHLRDLLLDENKLSNLPADMFTDMPALQKISLKNNNIKHLSVDTFKPLRGREFSIILNGNDLYCCSDFSWIVKDDVQKYFEGECKHPQIVDGKKIKDIKGKDFLHKLC